MNNRHLDLFSGIGGFTLAAERAGWRTIGFSEVDPAACIVLKHHWPHVKQYGDIRNVTAEAVGPIGLITGGFPCQPFSLAGKRRGKDDDRFLWPEMLRVIAEIKPTWVLGENVPGLIGMELERVLADLEGAGFEVQPLVIPACAVDAKHRRDRVWIMGHSNIAGRKAQRAISIGDEPRSGQPADSGTVGNPECSERRPQHQALRRHTGNDGLPQGQEGTGGAGGAGQDVSDSNQVGWDGRAWMQRQRRRDEPADGSAATDANGPGLRAGGRERLHRAREARFESAPGGNDADPLRQGLPERQGEDTGRTRTDCWTVASRGSRWEPEPPVGRVAHGIPFRSHRLRLLGNAIVPQVAEPILRWMYQLTNAG